MVSKRIPLKSVKRFSPNNKRSRKKTNSPKKTPNVSVTSATSVFIASLNASLLNIFTKLARIGCIPKHQKTGYHSLSKLPSTDSPTPPRRRTPPQRALNFRNCLPPLASPSKRTIVFDLDETLIHSKPAVPPKNFDFIVRPVIDHQIVSFFVQKRPGVDELLKSLAGEFEIVVFTAGLAEYASMVVDRLDCTAAISHRLYRDSCQEMQGRFVKDLSSLGRDLKQVLIVDDNPNAYALQPENAIRIPPFTGDPEDGELQRLGLFLNSVDSFDDMREAVKHYSSKEGGVL